jgi:hypothetical protein
MAAGVCAVVAAIAGAIARRSLSKLAAEEQTRFAGGVAGGQRLGGAAILDLHEPLVVDPSAPPAAVGRV